MRTGAIPLFVIAKNQPPLNLPADAAKGGYWVAAAHIAFPGIGHVRQEGTGYVFVPANYSAAR